MQRRHSRTAVDLGIVLLITLAQGAPSPGWSQSTSPAGDELPRYGSPSESVPEPVGAPLDAAGSRSLYFAPTDNDTTATELTVVNTTDATQTLPVRGFGDGSQAFAADVTILAHHKLRLVTDSIAPSPPLSWDTSHSIITNFGDAVGYASIGLPDGVLVDGAAVFNASTGVVDPRAYQGEIPLRFSELPAACTQKLIFEPEDTDGTGTVVTLYNTSFTVGTARIRGFAENGAPNFFQDIEVAPRSTIHLLSDVVAPVPPPSWDSDHVVLTNFGEFSTYVELTIPATMGVDGYVVYNPSDGWIDPHSDQGGVPLAFTPDPTYSCDIFNDGFESGSLASWSATAP